MREGEPGGKVPLVDQAELDYDPCQSDKANYLRLVTLLRL
jgi:hypothetical protein